MSLFRNLAATWNEDNLLRRVVKNSSYLFSSNVVSSVLSFVQTIVAVRLVGVANWGLISTIQTFASNINRFLSFRMSEVVLKHLGPAIAEDKKQEAAVLVKAAALVEAAMSIAAFLILILLTPWAAQAFARDGSTARLFIFYGFILLSNLVYETSTGVLQATHHFKQLARVNMVNSIITISMIGATYIMYRWGHLIAKPSLVEAILLAYVVGKTFVGVTQIILAARELGRVLGDGWWRVPLGRLAEKRALFLFALNTNLNGTANLFFRDNIPLYVANLLSITAVGYFKIAMTFIIPITLILDPFIAPTYAEISHTIAKFEWKTTLRLLKRITFITGGIVLAIWAGWALTGWWVIPTLYKPQALPVYPLLLILIAGYGFASVFQWNRSLFLSLGKPGYPVLVASVVGAIELALIYLLVPRYGYLMMAAILSGYFIISIGFITWRGLREVYRRSLAEAPSPTANIQSVSPSVAQSGITRQEQTPKPHKPSRARGVNRWDWLAVLVFLAFAVVYFLGRLQGNYPVVVLTGDGGNIASFAASLDHPGWFQADPVLGNARNIGIYATIHIPIIRALYRLTGDYGQAFAWLVLPQTFLQLLGFYLLGRVLFRNRLWAFLLAFLTAMTFIHIGLGEIWGVWQDALPRVTFQSLLPFLLTLTLVWKDRPGRWPCLMLFAGLLVYVHPISAPAWGLAIWLSLWLVQPKAWSWKRRILVMLGLGTLFLVVLAPYAANYLSYRSGDQGADYNTVMAILRDYSPKNLLNVPAALADFLWNSTRSLLLPVAVAGFVATWLLKKNDRIEVRLVLFWMAGLFAASVLLPLAEQVIEQRFQILPLETELVRCIRYFVPLMLLFWVWPLAEVAKRPVSLTVFRAVTALGIVLLAFWGATNRPEVRDMLQTFVCFTKARLVCPAASPLNELILTLRSQTQPGEGVFVFNEDTAYVSQSLSVRYAALRPLVYTLRDSGMLGYGNRAALQDWLATTQKMDTLREMPQPQERLAELVPLAKQLGASYLVIDFDVSPGVEEDLPLTVLMQNEGYSLFKLH